jgi:hypothetical protein
MLGRKNYTQEEFDHSRAEVNKQLAAYENLVKALGSATTVKKVNAALEASRRSSSTIWFLFSTGPLSTESEWSRARTATQSTKSKCFATP